MKKLFSIGSPVILVTLGVALLFIIRKKRKEKRLKRLRGERRGSFDLDDSGIGCLTPNPSFFFDVLKISANGVNRAYARRAFQMNNQMTPIITNQQSLLFQMPRASLRCSSGESRNSVSFAVAIGFF